VKNNLRNTIVAAALLFSLPQVSLADLTIKMKIKEGAQPEARYTMRFNGRRQRNEIENAGKGGAFAWVFQCDKKQVLGINYTKKHNFINALGLTARGGIAFNESQVPTPPQIPRQKVRHGGKVDQTVIITDTGERREMFGFLARHIKTSTVWEANPSCKQTTLREESDGWYIDLLYGVECSPDLSGLSNQAYAVPYSKCYEHYNKNRYEFQSRQTGEARFGFPLMLTRKVYGDQGKPFINYQEVVEVSTTELDQTLFDVPAGFVQVPVRDYRPSFFDRVFSLLGRR
jgi:hypothetical protein